MYNTRCCCCCCCCCHHHHHHCCLVWSWREGGGAAATTTIAATLIGVLGLMELLLLLLLQLPLCSSLKYDGGGASTSWIQSNDCDPVYSSLVAGSRIGDWPACVNSFSFPHPPLSSHPPSCIVSQSLDQHSWLHKATAVVWWHSQEESNWSLNVLGGKNLAFVTTGVGFSQVKISRLDPDPWLKPTQNLQVYHYPCRPLILHTQQMLFLLRKWTLALGERNPTGRMTVYAWWSEGFTIHGYVKHWSQLRWTSATKGMQMVLEERGL